MYELKKKFKQKQEIVRLHVLENIKKRLESEHDEKAIAAVQERYIFAFQGKI
jgi:hypothetical protein